MLGALMAAAGVLVSLAGPPAAGAQAVSQTFQYTGAEQTFTVPAGVTSIAVTAVGGEGGSFGSGVSLGATVTGSLSVTPGEVLSLIVAGNGEDGNPGVQFVYRSGGFGGGGRGGAGGGGATSIRGSSLLLVAGGGGGAGEGPGRGSRGGNAGEPGLETVDLERDCDPPVVSGGEAGTSSAGGLGGTGCHQATNGGNGQAWVSGVSGGEGGGAGQERGGGGGGGYWGGGGGGGWEYAHGDEEGGGIGLPGSGGGGSSLVPAGGTAALNEDGAPQQIAITYTVPPVIDGEANAKGSTAATAKLTAASGDLIVAFVSSNGGYTVGQTSEVSGGGLTWSLAGRENAALGDSEVWTARATSALTKAKITATATEPGYNETLTLVAFNHSSGVGQVAEFSSKKGAPGGHLSTAHPNSWVFAVGNDWLRSTKRTAGAGQTILNQVFDNVGDTYWVQSTNEPTPEAATNVTINDTAPKGHPFNLVLVEVEG